MSNEFKEKRIQKLIDKEIISEDTKHLILNSNIGIIYDSNSFIIALNELKKAVKFAEENNCETIKFWYGTDGATNYFKIAKDWKSEFVDITDYDQF